MFYKLLQAGVWGLVHTLNIPHVHMLLQVKDGASPGDLGFDPLNLKPSDPETWEKVQVHHTHDMILFDALPFT